MHCQLYEQLEVEVRIPRGKPRNVGNGKRSQMAMETVDQEFIIPVVRSQSTCKEQIWISGTTAN